MATLQELTERWGKEVAVGYKENGKISDLRSYNFPDRYLRHSNFEIWLHPTEDSDTFRKDSSFRFSDTRN
ncbi:AbfB domain-containing protein [Kitasatospora sp. NPDC057223]|uniref:AbfB domain-containing protein n=1 Tax=Kitasatospora sp. NPDC057223 TaxID=3346055 RepID=UPI0036276724